jgi:hypothetical protein
MTASTARHLHVVQGGITDDNGEVIPPHRLLAELEKLQTDLSMAQRDVRTKNRRIAELERDKAAERLKHPERELILRVCRYWHAKCRHGDKRVKPDSPHRYDAVAALVDLEELVPLEERDPDGPKFRRVYGPDAFKQAIDGAAYDPYRKQRKNGSWVTYNDLETICRTAGTFDEFRARAPR